MGDFLSDVFVLEFDFFHILMWLILLSLAALLVFLVYWICFDIYRYRYIRSKKHLSSAINVTINQLVTDPSKFGNQYIRVCGRVRKLIRKNTNISSNVILTPISTNNGMLFIPNTLVSSENKEYWIFTDNNESIVVFNEDFEIKSGEELILYGYWQKSEEDDETYILYIELAQDLIENN